MNTYFGVDYYPEHWPQERWETDAKLMQEMGIDVVRMAEFSWAKMEPSLGDFHFEWLEQAITILAKYGIRTILGTPTAAPPAWIIRETPEILPVDPNGVRREFGGRHHDCQSNPVYRAHIRRFVTAMAEYFKGNENVIGWQIDNELGNSHDQLCCCDSCTKRFQQWLKEKYGDIDTLNREWGNCFWSQEYNDFDQIAGPKVTVTGRNPSMMLDWKRFHSDLIVEFQQFQIDIIRSICPSNQFITHNCMGFADTVNYYDLGKSLDFVSHDQYPGGYWTVQSDEQLAAALDLMRAAKDQSFWIMEQQSGITGWEQMGRAPKPGQLSMWAMQSVAHGADTIVFFRWRVCAYGTEQYWHGVLPHSGNPGRRYEELKETIHRMRPLMAQLQGAVPHPEVGIVFSYDQEYAMTIQPHHPELTYVGQILQYYGAFYRRRIPVDFVSDQRDFSKYKLLVAPLQYLMTPELAHKYEEYVKNGGQLVLTMRAGVKNENNVCMTEQELPGLLRQLAGLDVVDYDCLTDTDVIIRSGNVEFVGKKWADQLRLNTAQSQAEYASEYYAGTPAVTCNQVGEGKVFYVGTEPDNRMADWLCGLFAESAQIASLGDSPEEVELAYRETSEGKKFLFALNHSDKEQDFAAPEGWKNYFEDQGRRMAPFAVHVYIK